MVCARYVSKHGITDINVLADDTGSIKSGRMLCYQICDKGCSKANKFANIDALEELQEGFIQV